jgi:phage terminase, large subunit, PBSX family
VHVAPLTGKALDAVKLSTARINVWDGSVRSSKTVGSLIRWLMFVRSAPPGNLLMAGRTERTLKRNIIDPLTEWLGTARCRHVAGSGELWLLGRRVYLAGANDELAQEKIRGLTLLGAYLDEASTVPQSFWVMLLSRLSEPGAALFATTNPDGPAHWLKRDYLDRAALHLTGDGQVLRSAGDRLNLHRFSFRLADNPHLTAQYIADLSSEYVGLWRRRLIDGEWVAAEGAVYDMWDPDVHVVDILPVITRWLAVGVDHGTTNPFHCVALGLGVDRRLYVTSEYRYDSRLAHRQLSDLEYSQRVRGWMAEVPVPGTDLRGIEPEWIVVDPAAPGFRVQLRNDGVPSVRSADNAVVDGIRLVSSGLAAGWLRVHRSCGELIAEIPGYSWDPKATAQGRDEPIKVNDHGVDATRYALKTTHFSWRNTVALEAA